MDSDYRTAIPNHILSAKRRRQILLVVLPPKSHYTISVVDIVILILAVTHLSIPKELRQCLPLDFVNFLEREPRGGDWNGSMNGGYWRFRSCAEVDMERVLNGGGLRKMGLDVKLYSCCAFLFEIIDCVALLGSDEIDYNWAATAIHFILVNYRLYKPSLHP